MLRTGWWLWLGMTVTSAFAGCYVNPAEDASLVTALDAGRDGHASKPLSETMEAGASSGLPCDVQALLTARCVGCHSDPPTSGPMSLVSYADLIAPSKSDTSKSVAAVALERMHNASNPMPPSNPLQEHEYAGFASWVSAGLPATGCVPDEISTITNDGGPECIMASDCPGELICRNGFCDVECVRDKDCPASWTCRQTRCQPSPVTINTSTPDGGPEDGGADASSGYRDFTNEVAWASADLTALATGAYNGVAFDGRYMYFAPDNTNSKVLRFDTDQPFGNGAAWSVFDLKTVNPNGFGYRGAVFDGRYVYLVPGVGTGLIAARFDTQAPFTSGSSWTAFSLKGMNATLSGFTAATFDGRYIYYVPAFGIAAQAARYDTRVPFDSASSWSTFSLATLHPSATSFAGAVFDGHFIYFLPWKGATGGGALLTRYDPQGAFADPASWNTLDLQTLNASAGGYHGGAFDGRYLYLVPGWLGPTPAWSSTTIARYDTQATFGANGAWTFFDMSALGSQAGGFNAAVFDGRYLTFAPGFGENVYRSDAYRFDTKGSLSEPSSWSTFDTQIIHSSLTNLKGTAFDGRYVYFAPSAGWATRFDAKTHRSMPQLPAFYGSTY